jgi:O-antigen ligase
MARGNSGFSPKIAPPGRSIKGGRVKLFSPGKTPRNSGLVARAFSILFGAFLGLTLLKFGNPPIMEKYVSTPSNTWEVLFNFPWPIGWAYSLLALFVVIGVFAARCTQTGARLAPVWLVSLPAIWLLWELLAANRGNFSALSNPTVEHFGACVVCFYLGFFCLKGTQERPGFWLGIFCGFLLILAVGWQQHFGGLAQTRQYFYTYIYPQLKEVSPEYLKKMSSTRIFSTLFYPNALAGALLLLLPSVLVFIWNRQGLTMPARGFILASVAVGALGCLFWSGSKGGWLLMLLLALLAVLRAGLDKRVRILLVTLMLLVGMAGFFAKYLGFFQRGATSVSARLDYWRAAVQIAKDNPVFGTGPGTFAITYAKIKKPDSEMSRLVHNDYLEQACDSGLPGFMAYASFVLGTLVLTGACVFRPHGRSRQRNPSPQPPRQKNTPQPDSSPGSEWQGFAIWLGLFGWASQGLFEFGLYIPALAWVAFAFMGLLLGSRSE